MTQSSLQTQCPKCRTRFRVTQEQLGIAKGKVRCGHCMDVFNATEHEITSTPTSAPNVTEKTPSEAAATGFSSDDSDDDFLFADNPEEDAAEGRYAGGKLTFSDDELSDSFRDVDEQELSSPNNTDEMHAVDDVDESWAEDMLREDSAPARRTPEPKRQEPEPEPEPDFTTHKPASPQHEEPFKADKPFGDLRHDPVSTQSNSSSWLRSLVWSLVVIGLIGALVAQVTWFQFDRLSAIPELRPFYEKGCELAGCKLAPLTDVDAIRSRKLVVRTNPDNRSQLIVDAVIVNRADFQQPFPAIALTFSNLNGDVVAQSIFTPSEYLAGEADSLDIMPTKTPVRIAIRIRDPGRDAVNYNMIFRPYTP